MTPLGWLGRKTSTQTNKPEDSVFRLLPDSEGPVQMSSQVCTFTFYLSLQPFYARYDSFVEFLSAYDEKQAQKRKEIQERPIFQSNKAQKLDITVADKKKLNIIKNHLRTAGSKVSPFDSRRTQQPLKTSLDKLSLIIRRKPVKAADQTNQEMCVDNNSEEGVRVDDETVTDSRVAGETLDIVSGDKPLNDCDNMQKESYNDADTSVKDLEREKDELLFNKESELPGNDKIDRTDKLNVDSVKMEEDKSQRCDNSDIDERKTCLRHENDILIEKSELKPTFQENDLLLQTEKCLPKRGKAEVGKDVKFCEKESKPDYSNDTKCTIVLKVDNISTVCDIKRDTSSNMIKSEFKADIDQNTYNSTNAEIKPERKSLSLVSSYSDSDSDPVSDSS